MLKNIVKELIKDGKMVLFSSHQMNYIEEFCDDIIILNGGKSVLDGSIKKIKRSYARNVLEIATQESYKSLNVLQNAALPFVSKAEILDGKLTVTLKDEESKPELIKFAAENLPDIDGIYVKEPTLADIFIHYTEGSV